MLGAIIGDVIGSFYEANPTNSVSFPLFNEFDRVTDDSILTVAVADGILKGETDYTSSIRTWGNRYPDAGYGGNFRRWLLDTDMGPYNSWGNGSAMRVSPVGWAFDTEKEVLEQAKKSADPTHNHPEGVKGAQAFCYRAIGENLWTSQDYKGAETNFEKAAELEPKNDFAYLRLGDIYWRNKNIDEAINAFAKAVAIGSSSAREARKQLYTLLRQRYGNTSNASTIINAAKSELGI